MSPRKKSEEIGISAFRRGNARNPHQDKTFVDFMVSQPVQDRMDLQDCWYCGFDRAQELSLEIEE